MSYALGEVLNYIRNLTLQEVYIKDVGHLAHDSFIGHIDEVIVSLKSKIFQSGGGHTGNLLNSGPAAQKTRIFMCHFNNPVAKRLNKKKGALRIDNEYENMASISHKDHILNQINANNADILSNDDFYQLDGQDPEYVGEGSNPHNLQIQKYIISTKRDLINQMLTKSNGIIFNFQNI